MLTCLISGGENSQKEPTDSNFDLELVCVLIDDDRRPKIGLYEISLFLTEGVMSEGEKFFSILNLIII